MITTDPIADFLTRIRNAIKARHRVVEIPASNIKKAITQVLYDKGFIQSYKFDEVAPQGVIKIARVLNGLGIAIVSTSKGVMTDKEARALKVGGEVLCYVY